MDAKNFTVAAVGSMVKVKTVDEAFKRIQLGVDPQHSTVYIVGKHDQLLFRYDGMLPPTSAPVPADDSPKLGDVAKRGKITGFLDKAITQLDSIEDSAKEKLNSVLPGKPKLKPTVSPVLVEKAVWVLQKAQVLQSKVTPDLMPVSPCIDSTQGDGGSISFSHGSAFSSQGKIERNFEAGWMVFAKYKDKQDETVSWTYSYSVQGTVPAGYKGQLFIKDPKFTEILFKQKFFQVSEVAENIQQSQFSTRVLDYNSLFEYHFLTSDKSVLTCDRVLEIHSF
ncbi:hypothetical protein PSN45_000062 [Yamadazyma tenuis]|uniref:uncharacterized protein n=1 Tax=Candida tenuis TaxID=2315449 RepID=UPI00279A9C6B|nr:hypothetical protein PSN45_000062 [Yamadazyma tenuis]